MLEVGHVMEGLVGQHAFVGMIRRPGVEVTDHRLDHPGQPGLGGGRHAPLQHVRIDVQTRERELGEPLVSQSSRELDLGVTVAGTNADEPRAINLRSAGRR